MLAPLRTPTAFVLLTLVVVGWASAWAMAPNPLYNYKPDAQYRPVHCVTLLASGRKPYWSNYPPRRTWGADLPSVALFSDGTDFCLIKKRGDQWFAEGTDRPVIAAGFPDVEITITEFGLLAPVVVRRAVRVVVLGVDGVPTIDRATAISGWNRDQTCGFGLIEDEDRTSLRLNRAAAVHDSFFLLTLLSWLVSLAAVPRWTLWRRLTPAQRRRARGTCPSCGYELAGLASSVCPECGNHFEIQAVP